MKKIINSLLTIVFTLGLFSCTHKFSAVEEYSTSVDSSEVYMTHVTSVTFSSQDHKDMKMLLPLNEDISRRNAQSVDSLKFSATRFFDEYDKMLKVGSIEFPRPQFRFELWRVDTTFIINKDIISILNTSYTYEGGAHGITEFYAYNYSPERRMFYKDDEIIDFSKEAVIDSLLKVNFKDPDNCFNSEPTLSEVAAINVTPTHIRFVYSHYTLGAYACGSPVVEIPITDLGAIYMLNKK